MRKIHTGAGDKHAGTTHTWRQNNYKHKHNGRILTVGQKNRPAHVTTNVQKTTADTWGE